ncbi:MAG: putative secreted protein [Parcubacteria bacterium C7867-007]|nr:MAG: putative secreted protein [Parcubacteria bacterium C7867-007]
MKKILIILVLILVAGIAYYGLSPLFRNMELSEEVPGTVQQENQNDSSQNTPNPEPVIMPAAQIVDTPAHPASGTARIVISKGTTYLRYENLKTINGPDLYVYLSKDLDAKEFVSLGRIKATEGNVNYEIPGNINLTEYPYALVWCKQFGVLFNSAKLQ